MKMTLKHLEVFVAVATTGNVTQAAELLYLTQSACSMSLANFEEQLDSKVFDRNGKKLVLNEVGRALFIKASNIITQVQELRDLMVGTKQGKLAGFLKLGASSTIGNYVLPQLLGDFLTKYPALKMTLKIDNTEQLIRYLQHGAIDIGVIEGQCHSADLEVIPWRQDDLVVIAPCNHPLVKKTCVNKEDLLQARWIVRESGSGTREKFEQAFGQAVQPFLELGHTEAVKQAVFCGLGIACLSQTAVSHGLASGLCMALNTPFLNLNRMFSIILHREKYQTAVMKCFVHAMIVTA